MAIELCEQGMVRMDAGGDPNECAPLRILLSICFCYQGDFSRAVSVVEAALSARPTSAADRNLTPETHARLLNQKAFALSKCGDFSASQAAFDDAQLLAGEAGSPV